MTFDTIIYSKDEIPFIGGTTQYLQIDLFDITGQVLTNASISSINWKMAKYGEKESLLTKTLDDGITFTETDGVILVKLDFNSTKDFYGVFDHQIHITDNADEFFAEKLGRLYIAALIN